MGNRNKKPIPPPKPTTVIHYLSVWGDGLNTEGNVIMDFANDVHITGRPVSIGGANRYAFDLPPGLLPAYAFHSYGFDGFKDFYQYYDRSPYADLQDIVLEKAQVLPVVKTLEERARVRAAIWTVPGPWPYGPRPNRPDNITAMEYIHTYGDDPHNLTDIQKGMFQTYLGAGNTHVAYGPIFDPGGYHNLWPPTDFRSPERFSVWLDWLQVFHDHNLMPMCFLHIDNQAFEETRDLYTPLILANLDRCRKLMQFVVPTGWEPAKYEWSSNTWAMFADWISALLPDALLAFHTVSDVDAPVGTDKNGDDNGKDNAIGWQRVAPKYHVWLHQSSAFEDPNSTGGDRERPSRTNYDNWVALFDPNDKRSLVGRFNTGYAGWPTSSKWGPLPLVVIPFEYCSYWVCWHGRSVAEGNSWGDRVIRECKVKGVGDGCSAETIL